eukprot:5053005-Pyramimonas_sp.AAC.1
MHGFRRDFDWFEQRIQPRGWEFASDEGDGLLDYIIEWELEPRTQASPTANQLHGARREDVLDDDECAELGEEFAA